jgi:hypothetical protein
VGSFIVSYAPPTSNIQGNSLSASATPVSISAPFTPSSFVWYKARTCGNKYPIDPNFVTTFNNFSKTQWETNVIDNVTGTLTFNQFHQWEIAAGGSIVLTGTSDNFTIPFFGVQLNVAQMAGNGVGDQVFCGIGRIFSGFPVRMGFIYDNVTETITGYSLSSGGANSYYGANGASIASVGASGAYSVNLSTTPFQIAAVFTDRTMSCWINISGAWNQVACVNLASVEDLRQVSAIGAFAPCFYAYNTTGSTPILINSFQSGYYGGMGYANNSMITYEDGTPLVNDNKQYFLASSPSPASASSNIVQNSVMGIYSIDQDTFNIQRVAILNTNRAAGGGGSGLLFGENAGCIIYDRTSNQWRCFVPNWGDGLGVTIQIFQYTTTEDILRGVHILTNGTLLNVPNPSSYEFVYDPEVRLINGIWYVAYTINNSTKFYPNLTSGTSLSSLGNYILNTGLAESCEGTKIRNIGGTTYILAGATNIFYLLNFTTLALVTSWSVTFPNNGGPEPHPNIFYVQRNGVTNIYLNTFDGYTEPALYTSGYQEYSEGNAVILHANQVQTGYEYASLKSSIGV